MDHLVHDEVFRSALWDFGKDYLLVAEIERRYLVLSFVFRVDCCASDDLHFIFRQEHGDNGVEQAVFFGLLSDLV